MKLLTLFIVFLTSMIFSTTVYCSINIPDQLDEIMKKYNEAVGLVENKEYEKAAVKFAEILKEKPNDKKKEVIKIQAAAANNLGNIMMLQGNFEEAEKYLRMAISLNPSHALALNNLGSALLEQGKTDEAIDKFQEAIEVNPSLSVAYSNLGEVFLNLGMLRKSADFFLANLRLDPANKNAFLNLIKIYDLSNLPQDRENTWQILVKVVGENPESLAEMVGHLIDNGSFEQTRKSLPDLLERFPGNPDLLVQKVRVLILENKWSEAKAILDELRKESPDNPDVLAYMAVVMLNENNIREADNLAKKAVRKDKNNPDNWFVYGVILEKQAKYKESREAYKSVLSLERNHTHAMNNLGVLAALENNPEVAIRWFEKALNANHFNQEARYNLARTLIISKTDYQRGVKMLVELGKRPGPVGERAREFIGDLEKIAAGEDPGWKTINEVISSSPR